MKGYPPGQTETRRQTRLFFPAPTLIMKMTLSLQCIHPLQLYLLALTWFSPVSAVSTFPDFSVTSSSSLDFCASKYEIHQTISQILYAVDPYSCPNPPSSQWNWFCQEFTPHSVMCSGKGILPRLRNNGSCWAKLKLSIPIFLSVVRLGKLPWAFVEIRKNTFCMLSLAHVIWIPSCIEGSQLK